MMSNVAIGYMVELSDAEKKKAKFVPFSKDSERGKLEAKPIEEKSIEESWKTKAKQIRNRDFFNNYMR